MVAASLAVCDRGLPLKWDAFRLRPALLLQHYVQQLSRWPPGRTECIGRDGRYFRDTCGIFVPSCLNATEMTRGPSSAPGSPAAPVPAPAPEPEQEPERHGRPKRTPLAFDAHSTAVATTLSLAHAHTHLPFPPYRKGAKVGPGAWVLLSSIRPAMARIRALPPPLLPINNHNTESTKQFCKRECHFLSQ